MQAMLYKDELLHSLESLPERVSVEDAMERLFLLSKVAKGCKEADKGKTIPHEEAEERMKKWPWWK